MQKKKSYKWPLIIVGLLVTHVAAMMTAVVIATSDKSFAVLPNYYQEAVKWDQTKARHEASVELGWKAQISVAPEMSATGERLVNVTIVDAAGAQVPVEKVELKFYHFSHASNPHRVTLTAREGKIEGWMPLRYEGFHEFNLTANAGEKLFVEKITQYVNAASRE